MPVADLPNSFEVGGEDAPVAADDWNAEIDGGGGYDAVRQIGDFCAGDFAHGFDDGNGKNGLGKNVFGVGERLRQFFIGRFSKTAFLDQIDQFSEADAGNGDFAPCRGCLLGPALAGWSTLLLFGGRRGSASL
jgi:hypothetical protein